jgi:hypothetical protein
MPSASGEKSPSRSAINCLCITDHLAENSNAHGRLLSRTQNSSERREPSNLVALNAQLYAQGITKSALKLDGLSSKHRDNVIRILQGMLQKRTVSRRLVWSYHKHPNWRAGRFHLTYRPSHDYRKTSNEPRRSRRLTVSCRTTMSDSAGCTRSSRDG